jgi:protein-tyrosine-phosphatase
MAAPNAHVTRILLIGGSARAALAACRSLGAAGHDMGRLRWHAPRTAAESSRHCRRAIALDPWSLGVAAWRQRFDALVERERFDILLPLDEAAHELLAAQGEHRRDTPCLAMPPLLAYRTASDRWHARGAARQSGWRTPVSQRLPSNGDVPSVQWPCTVRPLRAAAIIGDELATFSVREAGDASALDAKLRDALPRIDVVLESSVQGQTMDVLLAAFEGRLLGYCVRQRSSMHTEAMPAQVVEATQALIARLQCTGLLRLECARNHGEWTFLDLSFGAGDLLPACGRIGAGMVCMLIDRLAATSQTPAAQPAASPNWSDPWPALSDVVYRGRDAISKAALRLRALAWREPRRGIAGTALRSRPSILFVCKGNINRSLVAEQVLRAAGYTRVASAGLLDMGGRRPSAAAETFVSQVLGLPATALRSQSMNAAMRGDTSFEHVVCFERRHLVELARRHPELRGRLHLLSAWAGEQGQPPDIPDPHGGTEADYRRCFERIASVLQRAVGHADARSPRMATAVP